MSLEQLEWAGTHQDTAFVHSTFTVLLSVNLPALGS